MDTLVGLLASVALDNNVHLWHMYDANELFDQCVRNVWPPNRAFGSKPTMLYALVPLMQLLQCHFL